MNAIDLHVHSTFSDGTKTPKELINIAKEKGLAAIALTDHDTVSGIPEALSAAKANNFELIPGIELSTFFDKKEIHIVGLFIDYANEDFIKELEILRSGREEKNYKMAEKFREIGINIDYDNIKSNYPNCVITRAHFADYLMKQGFVKSRNEAFERYIGDGKKCYVDREKITPAHAINLIHSVGGLAILAHPILYHLGDSTMRTLIEYLCQNCIDGIEAVYSTYSTSEEIYVKKLASEYNLLLSGGSDYHGDNKPDIQLGNGRGHLFVPYEFLDNLKNFLNKKKA